MREDDRGRSEEKRDLTYVGLELVMSWEGRRNGTGVERRTCAEILDQQGVLTRLEWRVVLGR